MQSLKQPYDIGINIILSYIWGHWGTKILSTKITQPVSDGARFKLKFSGFKAHSYNHYANCPSEESTSLGCYWMWLLNIVLARYFIT